MPNDQISFRYGVSILRFISQRPKSIIYENREAIRCIKWMIFYRLDRYLHGLLRSNSYSWLINWTHFSIWFDLNWRLILVFDAKFCNTKISCSISTNSFLLFARFSFIFLISNTFQYIHQFILDMIIFSDKTLEKN